MDEKDIAHLLKRLTDPQRAVLITAAIVPPPVSLDTFIALGVLRPVEVLQFLEWLVGRKILAHHEESGNGYYYFPNQANLAAVLRNFDREEIAELLRKLIDFFEETYPDGPKKSLTITHLYQISGSKVSRLSYVIDSAKYCLEIGSLEAATIYFQMVIDNLSKSDRYSHAERTSYIDAVIGIISSNGHRMHLKQQRALLERALEFSKDNEDVHRQVVVVLHLAQVLKSSGDYTLAKCLFDEGWHLANRLGDKAMLKQAALFTADFLFWQGRVADAVARYEEVIGNLEEFSLDESTMKACATLGWCYSICGQTARGVGLIKAVQDRSDAMNFQYVKNYASLMLVLSLLEARLVTEAKTYLFDLLKKPEEILGNYILWAANAAMAFVLFHDGDLEQSFHYQKKAYRKSKEFGWPHHRGPWNFEYLEALEEAGFVHPEMNYDSELKRLSQWPDIYMQGVGLRYKAQRLLKEPGQTRTRREAISDLKRSIELLSEAGARLELARSQILLARQWLGTDNEKDARHLLEMAWEILSSVNESLFPQDLKQFLHQEDKQSLLINTLVEIGNCLGTLRDRKQLLERIITLTMQITFAERGAFFWIGQGGRLELAASRNLDQEMIKSGDFKPRYETIKQVAATGRECIEGSIPSSGGKGDGKAKGWSIYIPILLRRRILGVLYLDNSLMRFPLSEDFLAMLKVISNQVGVALDNVRAYEEIAELRDRLEEETQFYRMKLKALPESGMIVGKSKAICKVLQQIEKVAPTDSSVLIIGETGVGKELVAKAIHALSPRKEGPFIPVSTATLEQGVIASELFGHEKGAFTGALKTRRGRFELADKGTLFLDDVENLTPEVQTRLLRAIQEKRFERVGGTESIRSDFRLITATNQDLDSLVKKGKFRSDLYYRLKVFPIHVPPLRERKEDIPLLALHFLDIYKKKFGKNIKGISKQSMQRLMEYSWPGNVRELQHVIERSTILTDGDLLVVPALEETSSEKGTFLTPILRVSQFLPLRELERRYIIEVLKRCGWKVSGKHGAAQILEIKPTTLYAKMKKLNIKKKLE